MQHVLGVRWVIDLIVLLVFLFDHYELTRCYFFPSLFTIRIPHFAPSEYLDSDWVRFVPCVT